MKYILIFLLVTSSFLVEAEEKRLALVRRIQGTELLPESLSRQLSTLTLQVVTKQKDYELVLSGTDTPTGSVVEMVAVETEVGRTGNQYRIEARLLDIKSKKLITKASRDNIREEDLARLFQGALESLFLPDPEKTTESKEKEKEKPGPPKALRDKQKVPPTLQSNEPPASSLDFKQRVRELKSATDKAIAKRVEETKENAQNSDSKKTSSASGSNMDSGKPFVSVNLPDPNNTKSKEFPVRNIITAGYDSRQIDSDYFINTTTKAQLLTIKASGHIPLSFFDGKVAVSYDLVYSRALSAPVELPPLYQAGLYTSWLGNNWSSSLGLHRDASFFVNLPSPGEGITPFSLTTTLLHLKTDFQLDIKGPWIIAAAYGIPMQTQSDYTPLSKSKEWAGTSMKFNISPPFSYKNWQTSLSFERLNFTAQGDRPFTFNETRFALSLRRSL